MGRVDGWRVKLVVIEVGVEVIGWVFVRVEVNWGIEERSGEVGCVGELREVVYGRRVVDRKGVGEGRRIGKVGGEFMRCGVEVGRGG